MIKNKQNKRNKRNIKAYNSKMTLIRNRQYSCSNKTQDDFLDDALIINNDKFNRTFRNLEIKNNYRNNSFKQSKALRTLSTNKINLKSPKNIDNIDE